MTTIKQHLNDLIESLEYHGDWVTSKQLRGTYNDFTGKSFKSDFPKPESGILFHEYIENFVKKFDLNIEIKTDSSGKHVFKSVAKKVVEKESEEMVEDDTVVGKIEERKMVENGTKVQVKITNPNTKVALPYDEEKITVKPPTDPKVTIFAPPNVQPVIEKPKYTERKYNESNVSLNPLLAYKSKATANIIRSPKGPDKDQNVFGKAMSTTRLVKTMPMPPKMEQFFVNIIKDTDYIDEHEILVLTKKYGYEGKLNSEKYGFKRNFDMLLSIEGFYKDEVHNRRLLYRDPNAVERQNVVKRKQIINKLLISMSELSKITSRNFVQNLADTVCQHLPQENVDSNNNVSKVVNFGKEYSNLVEKFFDKSKESRTF